MRVAELVAPAVEQDTRKPFSTEAFYESVEFMKEFAKQRSKLVLRAGGRGARGAAEVARSGCETIWISPA